MYGHKSLRIPTHPFADVFQHPWSIIAGDDGTVCLVHTTVPTKMTAVELLKDGVGLHCSHYNFGQVLRPILFPTAYIVQVPI